jgi:signal transduction histidine kinase
VEVNNAAQRAIETVRPKAEARRIAIFTRLPVPLTVRGDERGVEQVLLNLLDNAVKYGPNEQTIRVALSQRDREVVLSVADEGPGVPAREREQIWSPFARGAAARAKGGSGIGLTIVQEVVGQHGGRCWVEPATPACGARFVVTFPMLATRSPNGHVPLRDPTWQES